MGVVREITAFDRVELIEPVEDSPAGARRGVLELRDGDTAMVEITTPELDPAARIVFVPLAKLGRVPDGHSIGDGAELAAPWPQAASCLIAASSAKASDTMAIVWSRPTSSAQMSK